MLAITSSSPTIKRKECVRPPTKTHVEVSSAKDSLDIPQVVMVGLERDCQLTVMIPSIYSNKRDV